jgi:hypothetical protein
MYSLYLDRRERLGPFFDKLARKEAGRGRCTSTVSRAARLRSCSSSGVAGRPGRHQAFDQVIGVHVERIAEREERRQRRLPLTPLQQGDERLIQFAFERQLRLGQPAFLPELLEQLPERGSEPLCAFLHAGSMMIA